MRWFRHTLAAVGPRLVFLDGRYDQPDLFGQLLLTLSLAAFGPVPVLPEAGLWGKKGCSTSFPPVLGARVLGFVTARAPGSKGQDQGTSGWLILLVD